MALCPFGEMLYGLLQRRGLGLSEFGALVDYPKQLISNVSNGHRPVPLERLDLWADELGLEGLEREVFLDYGALTHAPDRLKALVASLEETYGSPLRHLLREEK